MWYLQILKILSDIQNCQVNPEGHASYAFNKIPKYN